MSKLCQTEAADVRIGEKNTSQKRKKDAVGCARNSQNKCSLTLVPHSAHVFGFL